ncbi:hypothetical protein EDC96DRAFT_584963 [Choanephora cucurbitarum]|nr:hypothetical protein EDC96DRAFT_584963 [Choanephora cucurbitarum]
MEYFKCAHPPKWDFESYREHLAHGKTRQPKLRLLVKKHKHDLQLMKRLDDLSQGHMDIIDELTDVCASLVSFLKVRMSFDSDNRSIGVLGQANSSSISIIPSKRSLFESEDKDVVTRCINPTHINFFSAIANFIRRRANLVSTPQTNHVHQMQQYPPIILNELGNITKEKVIYEMDCEPSLNERLTCLAYLLLHPYTFSDNIYVEIRKRRRGLKSPITPGCFHTTYTSLK